MGENRATIMQMKRLIAVSMIFSLFIPMMVILPPVSASAPAPYIDTIVAPGFNINFTKEIYLNQTSVPSGEWKSYLYSGAWVDWTVDGAVYNFNSSASTSNRKAYIGLNTAYRMVANTLRVKADLDINNTTPNKEYFRIMYQCLTPSGTTSATVTMTFCPTFTLYNLDNYASGSLVNHQLMLYTDNWANSDGGTLSLDTLVSIPDGDTLVYYQNGVRWDIPIVGGSVIAPIFGQVYFSTSTQWTNNYTAVMKYIGLANLNDSSELIYSDNLQKSYTPYGYDMTLAFDIHADYMRYEMVDVAKNIADEYGVMGTLNTFVHGNSNYGEGFADNSTLLSSLKAARTSGWALGTHALSAQTVDRETAIEYLEEHKDLLGEYPQTWTDHGGMDHDLWMDGDDPSSNYYISDVLKTKLVAAWLNVESVYQAPGMDLNLNGMYVADVNGIDTYTASRGTYLSFLASVAPESYMGYMSSRSTIVIHDYLTNLCVVADGGTLIGTSQGTGVTPTPLWFKEPQSYYQNNLWYPHPAFKSSIETITSSGNIWSAGVSEIYQYTEAVRGASILDSATSVQITNPSPIDLRGLTLYTLDTEEPEYALHYNGKYYRPQAAADGWNFVIDNVPRGSVITLEKVYIPDFMPEIKLDSSGVMVWADENKTYIYAPQNGAAHVGLNYDYTDYLLLDSNGETIDYELVDGSIYWNVTRGELYEVQSYAAYRSEQMSAAMSPIFAIIPLVIIVSVIPMVMGLGRKLK